MLLCRALFPPHPLRWECMGKCCGARNMVKRWKIAQKLCTYIYSFFYFNLNLNNNGKTVHSYGGYFTFWYSIFYGRTFFILKQCETVRTVQEYGKKNSTKKVRSYRFGIQMVELLSYFCTIFLWFFIEYTYRNILILFVHFSGCVFTVCLIIYIFVY